MDSKGTCHFPQSRLPTAVGTISHKEVRVLRDTGCTGVVVRRSLVSDGQMLNKQSGVTLINNYKQRRINTKSVRYAPGYLYELRYGTFSTTSSI